MRGFRLANLGESARAHQKAVSFRVYKSDSKPCSRCRTRPASTPGNAYCKPCRAAYQRAWRARRKTGDALPETASPTPDMPRVRLRGTPTREEMVRYRLI